MAITHGTTVGGSQLPRIYDRLRKRSQRRTNTWYFATATDASLPAWMSREHAAYVTGVKDALNAVSDNRLIAVFSDNSPVAEFLPLAVDTVEIHESA